MSSSSTSSTSRIAGRICARWRRRGPNPATNWEIIPSRPLPTGIRSIEVYYGHLNARTGGPLIIDPVQKKSYDAVSAANPFAIDPAKITVEPGVSWLPCPIKLDGHAAVWSATR